MSGLSKRWHEEGTHQSGASMSKRQHEETLGFSNSVGKTNPSGSDYYSLIEPGQDGRLSKIQRTEPRDIDRRASILNSAYRYLPVDDPYSEIAVAAESRGEARDIRETRDVKVEPRDVKVEPREFKGDSRDARNDSSVDSRDIKVEREMQSEARGDLRDLKIERDYHLDAKSDGKIERDRRERGETRESWKDLKDHYFGGGDHDGSFQHSWYPGDLGWHTYSGKEAGKEISMEEDGEFCEAKEAVGENKVEWKREEKEKERERKRKEDKQRDWGDRDRERDDWRNSFQLNSNLHERKENIRDDREADRWDRDRERKDRGKDKERQKDKERDHAKKERSERDDKENTLLNEKEELETSRKVPDQENPEQEQKSIKESDGWKNLERDDKDRKKERDKDTEVDKHEKRIRYHEKDADEASIEGEGVIEREREVFGCNVQRKRMLRPRGHSQATTREPRSRFRPKDIDGSQGRSEASAVVYRVGECMQEIIKLWKEFEASKGTNNGESSSVAGPTLEIRIPAEHVTTTNRQVKGSQLWGTDIYTDDSDLVAVLMHTGYYRPTGTPPPPAIHELRATIRVLPPQDSYTSTLRNSVRSRAWGAASGCSYQVERCRIMKFTRNLRKHDLQKGGGSIELEPCLMRFSAVAPTLAPAAMERSMTTRAAASSAYRQQRYAREVSIQYNLCNEPWMKYSIGIVADRGLKKSQFTSARLKKGEVLYVETHANRYELSYDGEKALCNGSFGSTTATSAPLQVVNTNDRGIDKAVINENEKHHAHGGHSQNGDKSQSRGNHDAEKSQGVVENFDRFKWARCKQPLPQKVMRAIGIPLPPDYVQVLEENLDWEETQWSQTGVWVRGKEYPLARAHFVSSM